MDEVHHVVEGAGSDLVQSGTQGDGHEELLDRLDGCSIGQLSYPAQIAGYVII
jgi:hypothetical protein